MADKASLPESRDIDQVDDSFVLIEKCYLGEANGLMVKGTARTRGDCDLTISNFK